MSIRGVNDVILKQWGRKGRAQDVFGLLWSSEVPMTDQSCAAELKYLPMQITNLCIKISTASYVVGRKLFRIFFARSSTRTGSHSTNVGYGSDRGAGSRWKTTRST